jgi:hypothetical protein
MQLHPMELCVALASLKTAMMRQIELYIAHILL